MDISYRTVNYCYTLTWVPLPASVGVWIHLLGLFCWCSDVLSACQASSCSSNILFRMGLLCQEVFFSVCSSFSFRLSFALHLREDLSHTLLTLSAEILYLFICSEHVFFYYVENICNSCFRILLYWFQHVHRLWVGFHFFFEYRSLFPFSFFVCPVILDCILGSVNSSL